MWRFLTHKRIVWNFIIKRTPWWGGYWERLVQSIKRPLKKVVGRSTLNFDELNTVLVEIESVINSRPITYVYDDKDSNSCPLTPLDLIYGRRIFTNPNASHQQIMSTYQSLTRRLRHHKNLLQPLTNQWRKEYLTSLRERRQLQSRDNKESVSVGDLVVLKNESTSRIYWKLAKVEELIYGADRKARAAVVKVANNTNRPVYLRTVIQHLIPIEVQACSRQITEREISRPEARVNDNQQPRRIAAVVGEINCRDNNIS